MISTILLEYNFLSEKFGSSIDSDFDIRDRRIFHHYIPLSTWVFAAECQNTSKSYFVVFNLVFPLMENRLSHRYHLNKFTLNLRESYGRDMQNLFYKSFRRLFRRLNKSSERFIKSFRRDSKSSERHISRSDKLISCSDDIIARANDLFSCPNELLSRSDDL